MNETQRAVARVYVFALLRMWCSAWSDVSSCVLVYGSHTQKGQAPPDPKGWTYAAGTPDTLADLLGARAEKVPSTSTLPFSHSLDSDGNGCVKPCTRVSRLQINNRSLFSSARL